MGIRTNIANLIESRRKAQNLSMEEMAQELGIPRSSLQSYVKGSVNLRADTIELLARKLELEPEDLITNLKDDPSWQKARQVACAAQEIASLSKVHRAEGIDHFLNLVRLFSEDQPKDLS